MKKNKIIGITFGSFDLCHYGHALMFEECKEYCDYLIVGVQSDPSIDRPEKNQPVQSHQERVGIVSSLKGPGDDSTLVQVDAALNVGNSGGPIVDESSGQLVAVSVLTMDKSVAEGQNFGIKTSSVKNFLNANKVKVPFGFNFNRDVADSLEKSTLYVYCY